MQPTDALYYKYAGVIDSVVNNYAHKCPDIKDDLYLQAQLVFCQACLSYDPNHPSHASFETWLRRQLESITALIKKAASGPSLIKGTNMSAIPMAMIEVAYNTENEEDYVDISNIANLEYVHDYGVNLETMHNSDYPPEMQPYIDALSGDSLKIFQDFCAGKFDLAAPKFKTIAKQKADACLNPIRIYRRVYIHEGWSLDRVKEAWKTLHSVISNYRRGKLPSKIYTKDTSSVNTPMDNKRKKWMESFKDRHKISYNEYRSLRKRGLIPTINKNMDVNVDLSNYVLAQ